MAKLADNINALLAAAGVKLTDEQSAVLAELPQDEVSPTIQALFDTAANQATNELAKLSSKAANLDKFDTGLEKFAALLGDDIKPIVKEKGPQKLEKVYSLIEKKIEEAKTAAAGGQNVDLEKLRSEITQLQQKAQSLEAEKDAEVAKVRSDYEDRIHKQTLLTRLQGRKDLIEQYTSQDALSMFVLPKVLQYIDGKNLKITPDKLDVVNKETGAQHVKGSKVVTLDEMFDEALSENKFRQNAGPTPPKTSVETGGSDAPRVTRASLLRPEIREV